MTSSLTPSAAKKLSANASAETSQSLFEEFRAFWRDDRLDVHSFLSIHPEIADDPELFLDLIYDEWLLRQDAGEHIELREFAKRYPGFESSFCKLAAAEEAFRLRPDLLDEPEAWPAVGDHLLGFQLLRPIGQGTFARVFLAEELSVGRKVVLKVSKEDLREAKLLGQLDHPNIVKILSADDDPITGCSVVCMPYLGEATLSRILQDAYSKGSAPRHANELLPNDSHCDDSQRSRQPARVFQDGRFVDGALHLMLQLSDAVGSAHSKNIQHRDIKPTNILVTRNGDVQLLDFNLSVDETKIDKRLGGTLPYMSPEQLHAFVTRNQENKSPRLSDAVGKKSDVYSLGVLFYELLTGAHPSGPFAPQLSTAQFCEQLLAGLNHKPTPVCEINPNVPPKLSRVIGKCLEADPNNRFADANELHAALQSLAAPVAHAKQFMLKHVRAWGTGVAAAVWVLVMCIWSWAQQPDAATRHWNRAIDAAAQQRWDEANANVSAAMEKGARTPQAYYLRGRLHVLNGQWSLAIKDLHKALPIRDGRVPACLAYCYTASDTPDFILAEKYYHSAIQMGFANAAVYNNLAFCRMKQKGTWSLLDQESKANPGDLLRYAIRLDPSSPTSYYNLARWERDIAAQLPRYNPLAGIRAINRAIGMSRPNARLFLESARLCIYAAKNAEEAGATKLAETWIVKAEHAVHEAIHLGFPRQLIGNEKLLVQVYHKFLETSSSASRPNLADFPAPAQLIDPLAGRIE